MLYDQTEENGSGKSKLAAIELEVFIPELIDNIGTRFQRLNLCFWGFKPTKLMIIIVHQTESVKPTW